MDSDTGGLSFLTWFGLIAAVLMLITYAAEEISHWFVIAFAVSCVLGAVYLFLQGAYPFAALEAIWAVVAWWRWHKRRRALQKAIPPAP